MHNAKGFTLIELVVVLVIVGILAAVAVPRFIDLSGEAEAAALQAQASNMASAAAINYAKWAANGKPADATTVGATQITSCQDVADNLLVNFDGARFTVSEDATGTVAFTIQLVEADTEQDCSVSLA